jgi:UDP-N-acetylenolpyruvoylglucosamine reductase
VAWRAQNAARVSPYVEHRGGAYGRETKDALIQARGVDRQGRVGVFSNGDMHYSYRHCGAPDDIVFTEALFQGTPGDAAEIASLAEIEIASTSPVEHRVDHRKKKPRQSGA